ncbi:transcription antitermination factor NusB [Nocardioides nematodiphilus]|uniref:transcription antitermination factor NusB n=1 Tax=Nocardioides nematodiphilus TaxID=2849669 RepID=UPI001CD9F1E7|nr:transcription antitermination factor NusB [Nocardioides nematodiphilus]MCA1982770.1 transcription antitermination factor NusB [Nocardioides nematodiphilus]
MSARSKARKRALDILFAAEAQGTEALDLLVEQKGAGELNNPYTATLVQGVIAQRERIDEILGQYAQGWTLDRMPAVDRNVLRLGAWELLFAEDVPEHVALSEAVELVRELSTDESPAYVNGVLGSIQRAKADLV